LDHCNEEAHDRGRGFPILTIMAMAKRVARIVSEGFAQP
jgi:hypothetical protein